MKHIIWIFVRIASLRRFSQISKTYVLWGKRNKTRPFLHINLLIKYSVQQQIQFNGNIFGNECCRCNEDSLYFFPTDRTEAVPLLQSFRSFIFFFVRWWFHIRGLFCHHLFLIPPSLVLCPSSLLLLLFVPHLSFFRYLFLISLSFVICSSSLFLSLFVLHLSFFRYLFLISLSFVICSSSLFRSLFVPHLSFFRYLFFISPTFVICSPSLFLSLFVPHLSFVRYLFLISLSFVICSSSLFRSLFVPHLSFFRYLFLISPSFVIVPHLSFFRYLFLISPLVPRKGCALWSWHFLDMFTYVFDRNIKLILYVRIF